MKYLSSLSKLSILKELQTGKSDDIKMQNARNPKRETASGFVISDLHIFTEWTSVEFYMEKIHKAADNSDFFVLNGDIFDFKWSTLPTAEETAEKAADWLKNICNTSPACSFYYILGNHDAHIKMLPALRLLEKQLKNFKWSPTHFFIGSFLFLHGDLLFKIKKTTPFHRPDDTYLKAEPKHRILSKGYNMAIGFGAHHVVTGVLRTKQCASYSYSVLKKHSIPEMSRVSDVFIGHTHASFSNFRFKDLTFHNTGSAVADLHCNMINLKQL
jgi:UDP-2,3-diacylglucosamine hydrolase